MRRPRFLVRLVRTREVVREYLIEDPDDDAAISELENDILCGMEFSSEYLDDHELVDYHMIMRGSNPTEDYL